MRQEQGGAVAAPSAGAIRVPTWAYPLVTVLSLLLGAEAVVRGTRAIQSAADSDLTTFFFKSADYILRGDPWHMYAVRAGIYPNYNPPLSIVLMAPLLGLARSVGFAQNYGEQITFVSLPFLVFVPLLGYLVLRVLRSLYPQMPETQRLLAYMLVTLSPLTWQTYGTWYHIEQPMMLCLLLAAVLALQARREGLAGVLAGLALMSRTTALMPLIALGLLLVVGREWRGLLKLVGASAAVVLVVMAPFLLGDRADTTYAFLSWRGSAEIGGNSIWSLFASSNSATGFRHVLDATARRLDMPSVLLFVTVVALLAATRLRISAYGRDAWAVLAIAALAVPMLSKTNWPYYYLEPFIPLLIWEFASMHDRLAGLWRWPVLSFGFLVVAGTLSQYIGLRSVGALDRFGVGLLEFATMLAFAWAIWQRVQAVKPSAVSAYAGAAAPSAYGSYGAAPAPWQPAHLPQPEAPTAQGPNRGQGARRLSAPVTGGPPIGQPAPADPRWSLAGMQSGTYPPSTPQTPAPPPEMRGAGWPGTPPGTPPRMPTVPANGPAAYGPANEPRRPSNYEAHKGGRGEPQARPGQPPAPGQSEQWPDLDPRWPPRPPTP